MSNGDDSKIREGSRVTLHFSLSLASGELIDSNFDKAPPSFHIGDGSLLPGFEECLRGLQAGDEAKFHLAPAQAFGEINAANRQTFSIEKFRHLLEDDLIPTEEGTVVSFKDAAGYDLPGVISRISGQNIEVDFNHPLAGKDILFRVRIVNVLDADQQAIDVKL